MELPTRPSRATVLYTLTRASSVRLHSLLGQRTSCRKASSGETIRDATQGSNVGIAPSPTASGADMSANIRETRSGRKDRAD